jgi:hypothetical protein
MALVTKECASFDNGKCVWSYEYDDVGLFVTNMSCINNGNSNTRGTVVVQSNGRTFTQLVAPGANFSQAIPTGAAVRLGVTIDARGRVDGIDWSFSYGSGIS